MKKVKQKNHIFQEQIMEKNPDYAKLTARDVMTANPKTINVNALALDALNLMKQKNITNLFVVNDKDEYLGVIHIHDLIREGIF